MKLQGGQSEAAPAAVTMSLLVLASLGAVLGGCFDDRSLERHPCDRCDECETCIVSSPGTANCLRPTSVVCAEDGNYRIVDSCGDDKGLYLECEYGECGEPGPTAPARPEGLRCECDGGAGGFGCELCLGNWDADKRCRTCRNAWSGDDCQSCPTPWDPAQDCGACLPNVIGDDCSACRRGYIDPGSGCRMCDKGWEKDAQGTCNEVCGNGIATASEACDDGADNGNGEGTCTADCRSEQRCGNDRREGTESCDIEWRAVCSGSCERVPMEIAVGLRHRCRIDGGTLLCRGDASQGQLRGAPASPTTEVPIMGTDNSVEVEAHGFSTCVRSADGSVSCWGTNGQWALNPSPLDLPAPAIDIGQGLADGCAVLEGGALYCWGENWSLTLDGRPTRVALPVRAVAVEVGSSHGCVLLETGSVRCWGDGFGLGFGTAPQPVEVAGIGEGIVMLAAGDGATCAVLRNGKITCWGVLDGGAIDSQEPSLVQGLAGPALAVAVGTRHACALLVDGDVQCWGDPDLNRLGGPAPTGAANVPVTVQGVSNARQIVAGFDHSCALTETGQVCWGNQSFYE